MIVRLGEKQVMTRFGEFTLCAWYDGLSESHSIHVGSLREARDVPVRLHSSCVTSHYFNGISCDCCHQMAIAQSFLQQHGCGLIILLQQEAKGNGILATLNEHKAGSNTSNSFDAFTKLGWRGDARDYKAAASIITALDIPSVVLLSNNRASERAWNSTGFELLEPRASKPRQGLDWMPSTRANEPAKVTRCSAPC